MKAVTRRALAGMSLCLLVISVFFSRPAAASVVTNDVGAHVEYLGNPFTNVQVYVRNVWSIYPYNGLLYFGYGNASDLPPENYSGAVSVFTFNPTNSTFSNQFTMNEQQVDHYRVFDGKLITPGFNPDSLISGNGDYYVQETNGWKQFANVTDGVHTFDMYEFSNLWFAALGNFETTMLVSTNHGTNWAGALSTNLLQNNTSFRIYSLFQLGGTLYSMTLVSLPSFDQTPTLLRYDTNQGVFVTNSGPTANHPLSNFCPNISVPIDQDCTIARSMNVSNKLLYIFGLVTNDMQWDPEGLFWATNVTNGQFVSLTNFSNSPQIKAWDIFPDGNRAWVLLSSPVSGSTNYWVHVMTTEDFTNWVEVMRFQTNTFARSFTMLNGDLYFGLGCETNVLVTNTGSILRVRSQYFSAVVTWTNPSPITYGTALSAVQLDATSNLLGTFVYVPPAGTILNTGTNVLTAIFTPSNTNGYNSVTNTVSLVVSNAPLTVTAGNAMRAFGQPNPAFQGIIAGLQNGDNITANYSCTATSSSMVGPYPIMPSLNDPANRETNYSISLVPGTLTVTQAVVALTWTNPAPITYGTGLSPKQLNATASAPGTFAYTPTNGAVLYAGTNTLSVIFTPNDAVDFIGATNTVSLVVLPGSLTVTAANAMRPFGQPNPAFQGTIAGLQNGDSFYANYSCTATVNSAVGAYPIMPSLNDPANLETNYSVSLVPGTLTVTQAAAAITWTNPSPITYGTGLSTNQLNATASVPGTFAYNPTNGAELDAGTNTLVGVFTPSDAVDYASATNTASLIVSPAPLTATAADAVRVYGQTNPVFGGVISGLQNGDNITAIYSCSADTNSSPGNYDITPILIDPDNRLTNYQISLADGTLTLAPASPVITWTNPAPITYGTPLSGTQLNATASVPGSFIYNPTNGTVLGAGTNTVFTIFTPSDAVDYISAVEPVSLLVLPATLTVTASNVIRAFGQTNPVLGGIISGLQNGDVITASFSCSADTNSPQGEYPITPTLIDPGNRLGNYQVSVVNGMLTVVAPFAIQNEWQAGGSLSFTWSAISNQLYQIQAEFDVTQPDWSNFGPAFVATNSTMTISETIGTNGQLFYRVLITQ